MLRIPSPIGPPSTITVIFKSPIFGADLTDVTSIALNVRRQNGTVAVWTAEIISATASELVAQYELQTGDIDGTGIYTISPQLTVTGGAIPSETITAFVGPGTPLLETDAWLAATAAITSNGPVARTWQIVDTGPYAAIATRPFIGLDLQTSAIGVTLWAGQDGDVVTLADIYAAASSHALTLTAAGTSKVPVGDGTYASSAVYSATFVLRLRYSSVLDLWIPW